MGAFDIAKGGVIADFKTGYLQRELPLHQCSVTGGLDASFDGKITGFAVGRLVKVTANTDGTYAMAIPTSGAGTLGPTDLAVTPAQMILGDATHIVAQSDNSLRNFPEDRIETELYTTRYRGILANTASTAVADMKTVAVWRITNPDDIRLIPVRGLETNAGQAGTDTSVVR